MNAEASSFDKLFLSFHDPDIEAGYRADVLQRTLPFCRIAWGLVIILGGAFSYLDQRMFGADGGWVLALRLSLLGLAAVVVSVSFLPRFQRLFVWSSGLFVTSTGLFCIALVGFSDPNSFTPYFAGLFLAFAGVFSTPGIGFKQIVIGLLVNLVVFELVVGVIAPVSGQLFLVYNFFLPGVILVFAYSSYLIERTSRSSFATRESLRASRGELQRQVALMESMMAELSESERQLEKANVQLKILASIDELTQIANRRQFDYYLEQQWRHLLREKQPLAVIIADIDHFKRFNDTYGHQAGDECLFKVAQAISGSLHRPLDLAARFGGEEFIVLLPNATLKGATRVAENIQKAIAGLAIPHATSGVSDHITVSMGGASVANLEPTSSRELIAAADQALYEAKSSGRNRIVLRGADGATTREGK